jgi:hypothetical protein
MTMLPFEDKIILSAPALSTDQLCLMEATVLTVHMISISSDSVVGSFTEPAELVGASSACIIVSSIYVWFFATQVAQCARRTHWSCGRIHPFFRCWHHTCRWGRSWYFAHVGQGLLVLFLARLCQFGFCFLQLLDFTHLVLMLCARLSSMVRRIASNTGKTSAGTTSHERLFFRIAKTAAFATGMCTCSVCTFGIDCLIEQEPVIALKRFCACVALNVAVLQNRTAIGHWTSYSVPTCGGGLCSDALLQT